MLVGIQGQMNSGKDEVAQRLVKYHNFTKMALADPMKRFAFQVFGFTDEQLWGPSENRNKLDERYKTFNDPIWVHAESRFHIMSKPFVGYLLQKEDREALEKLEQWFEKLRAEHTQLSPRIMLQTLGAEWGRAFDPDIWINCLINRASSWTRTPIVVSDVRYINELKLIKEANGKLIRLKRFKTDKKAVDIGIKNHSSETEQLSFRDDQFDFIVVNDGTLEDLYKKIDIIAPKLR